MMRYCVNHMLMVEGGGGELTIVLKLPSEKDGEAAVEESALEASGC